MNLTELLKVADAQRTIEWENQLLTAFADSHIQLLAEEPQSGPDGWPYMVVKLDEQGSEPAQKLLHWTAQRGIGIVINPQKTYPDFVLTYGMIWQFRETGFFIKRNLTKDQSSHASLVDLDFSKANFREPSVEILPDYVKVVLRDFFSQQQIQKPRISICYWQNGGFDLVFSLESLGSPQESEHAGIAEALSWFLPPHYSIMFFSEKQIPAFWDL
jgi:hypothetical protein